ncbi:unnamed protein product [Clonostachys byssicola]|uniref:MYND-type domain-containing protein n=1 Tax=Clonostachys byssicola TaxID=160290 RepID=A0A9N9XWT7_9HYPO|nr:unnamed protein product [Clonostachys byssicola]
MERPKLTGHRRLPPSLIDKDQKCENCHQPGATKTCTGCKIEDIGSICTRYCSEACQKQHWSLHKSVCRDRRRLSRAVRLLSEVWDAFSTLTYDGFYSYKVEKGGFISTHGQPDPLEELVWTGGTIFRDFHRDVVPHGADEAVKLALLHDSNCSEVNTVGLELVGLFLKPVCSIILEAHVHGKDLAMFIVPRHGVTRDNGSHWVLYVLVSSGERFAIDITGAQFGWHEKMYEWDVYLQHRAAYNYSQKLGTFDYQWSTEIMVDESSNSYRRQSCELRGEICRAAGAALNEFLLLKQTSVLSLLSVPDAEAFSAQKMELVERAISSIKETIHEITVVQGRGRWYLELKKDPSGKFRPMRKVVDQENFAKKIRKAYFTREEVETFRFLTMGNPEELQEILQVKMFHRQKEHGCLDA